MILSPKMLVSFIIVFLIIIGVGVYGTYDYIQNDPAFCRSCHIMESAWEKWSESPHNNVTCHKCHEQSMKESMDLLYKYVIERPEEVSRHAIVPNERCENCHFSHSEKWPYIADTPGHKKHVEDEGVECITCHAPTIHVFKPLSSTCDQCHDQFLPPKMHFHCLTCHEFTVHGKTSLLPEKTVCEKCHTDREYKPIMSITTNAHSGKDCKTCHRPHESIKPLPCTACHEVPIEGLHGVTAHRGACSSCHLPHQERPVRQICLTCHVDKSVHKSEVLVCTTCHK